jgi:outer membrane immunogenic protein
MRRLFLVLGSNAAMALSAIATAAAADLPPPIVVPAAQVFSWTGFYIGGNAGYGWTNASGTLTTTTGQENFNATGNGFLGGAQAGYNWQIGPAVLGAEVDFQGTTANGTFSAPAGPAISATDKLPWFGTLDRVLLYATGGAVYGDSTMNGTVSTVGPFSSSSTFWTWTAGAGVEAAFWGCWSAKLEYLYMGTPSRIPSIPAVTTVTASASSNIVRAGINYHF